MFIVKLTKDKLSETRQGYARTMRLVKAEQDAIERGKKMIEAARFQGAIKTLEFILSHSKQEVKTK